MVIKAVAGERTGVTVGGFSVIVRRWRSKIRIMLRASGLNPPFARGVYACTSSCRVTSSVPRARERSLRAASGRPSLAAKSVKAVLEGQQKSFQAEMTSKEQSLQAKEKELAGQRSVLAPEEFEKKVKDFRTQATVAQREVQTKKAKLDKAFVEALADIQKEVVGIVSEQAKEKGYDAVMPTSQLLYAHPRWILPQRYSAS